MDALVFPTMAEAQARNQLAFEQGQGLHLFPEGTLCFASILAHPNGQAFAVPWPEDYRVLLSQTELEALEPIGHEWYAPDLGT